MECKSCHKKLEHFDHRLYIKGEFVHDNERCVKLRKLRFEFELYQLGFTRR